MRLAFAMLADAAVVTPDGKIQIQGGDIDTVNATAFPALQPQMVLVVKLAAEPSELGQAFLLQLETTTPQRVPWFPPFIAPFAVDLPAYTEGRPIKVAFVFNLPMLIFSTAGEYRIRLSFKREHSDEKFKKLVDLPIFAVLGSAAFPTVATTVGMPSDGVTG